MKLNKYLKELGLTWYDLPGNYISKTSFKMRARRRWYKIKRGFCFMFSSLEDKAPEYNELYEKPAYEKGNKEDKEGFCDWEFFSLDYSMALYIYPRLCEFRKEYAPIATPGCFCFNEDGSNREDGNEEWLSILDKMIEAFKLIITDPTEMDFKEKENKISEGLELFGKYYQALWY